MTYKMKFGHRGFNHAVREIATGRVDFTSQNHGYAVAREDLPECLMITHEEINDKSVEGYATSTIQVSLFNSTQMLHLVHMMPAICLTNLWN